MEEKNPFKKWQAARDHYERTRRQYRYAKDNGGFYKAEIEGFKEEMEAAKIELEIAKLECEKALAE